MSRFIVEGKKKLSGCITVSGNKNEALPLIAASLLSSKPVTLSNVPAIGDVRTMCSIAEHLGVKIVWQKEDSIEINAEVIKSEILPEELSSKIRASILFASSLLVRTGRAVIITPGGDAIGRRRIDTHFLAFKALGAKLWTERKRDKETIYILEAPYGLKGNEIYLDEASVTATENAIIGASGAEGKTTIINAACEPHVQGLCRFLERFGVKFEGIGSNVLTIIGKKEFREQVTFSVGYDYIEAGSFIGMAAATGSNIKIKGIEEPKHLKMILMQFDKLGVSVEYLPEEKSIHVTEKQSLKIKRELSNAISRIDDGPWPAFPTDLMSILLVTATQCEGTVLFHEKMFESRLFFVDKLISMGAQIVLCDPHRAVVIGPSPLYSAKISSPDIRAGMALLIAALAAEGCSTIENIGQIDRGYLKIDERLRALGASIERVD